MLINVNLKTELATTWQTIIEHSHLTKLSISARDVVINVASLLDLTIQHKSAIVTVNKCALKTITILPDMTVFNAENVDWSALENLTLGPSSFNYWTFVDRYLSKSDVNLKSVKDLKGDTFFRITKVSLRLY